MIDKGPASGAAKQIVLKALLRQRHLQSYSSFIREYNRVAGRVDKAFKGHGPSKAQYYRWLSGELVGLPYSDHCLILEAMFPDWKVEQLFEFHTGGTEVAPDPPESAMRITSPSVATSSVTPHEMVALYSHRADTPKKLWMNLLAGATERIDLFANASLFLPEENPEAIRILKEKARNGVKIRILLGDPEDPAISLRGREERLFEQIPGRIRMALAYYRPLVGLDGIEFRLHGTSLYNSIFRYDNQMLVNQHIYGMYGYIAPILHLRKQPNCDLFDTYMRSLDLVWKEESHDIQDSGSDQGRLAHSSSKTELQ
ncbi:hypothetical protein [Amycolatopsis sp.]|jgi:hypothetical protein|uniref:hypothetical protein n=1 Tax=Amycolatopsis sp. TaxID=37632 RepID=UPI002E0C1051|nr:hypothetical protein [Amycolatopsis sp.]